MRKVDVYMHGNKAGELTEIQKNKEYLFTYNSFYTGPPVSVTMPVEEKKFTYKKFPTFFEGLLPEGTNLEFLLRLKNIDKDNPLEILLTAGSDMVGAVTIKEAEDESLSDHV